jgi:hypothetical protein
MNSYRVAVVWRGDRETRQAAMPQNNRYHRIFEELVALGITAEPAVFDEEFAAEVREQLLKADAVLVWVDPLSRGRTRAVLDPLLREVAASGRWVSAHPDVILKMGTKEILYRTRELGWGTDTRRYRTAAQFAAEFPALLGAGGPRVLKQNRGNDGQGVWKVEPAGKPDTVLVLEARRGSMPEELPLAQFIARCEAYFAAGGLVIDQPFQPRLPAGMIRCYMGVGAAAGGPRLARGAARPAPHARSRRRAVSGVAVQDGRGMDAADDEAARHRRRLYADRLGRRFSLRPAHRVGRGHICPLRNQCQLSLRHPR